MYINLLNKPDVKELKSVMRYNLLTVEYYAPYCGEPACMHRVYFAGNQFQCDCGFITGYDVAFMNRYYKTIESKKSYFGEDNPRIGQIVAKYDNDFNIVGRYKVIAVAGGIATLHKLAPNSDLLIPYLTFTVNIGDMHDYAFGQRDGSSRQSRHVGRQSTYERFLRGIVRR